MCDKSFNFFYIWRHLLLPVVGFSGLNKQQVHNGKLMTEYSTMLYMYTVYMKARKRLRMLEFFKVTLRPENVQMTFCINVDFDIYCN